MATDPANALHERQHVPSILLLTVALFCLSFTIAFPIINPDSFLHLAIGRHILRLQSIPRIDWLSWTRSGAPWVDYEWAAQVVYEMSFHLAGLPGLFVLKSILLLATAGVFLATLSLYEAPRPVGMICLALWACGMLPMADLKPEQFSLLAFSGLYFLLERRRLRQAPLPLWQLIVLFAAWANFHPGFLFGLVLIAAYWVGEIFESGRSALGTALAAAGVGTFLQPYGLGVYRAVLFHAVDLRPLHQVISEWARPQLWNPWYWPFFLIFALSLIFVFSEFIRRKRLPAGPCLAWLLFAAAGFSSGRFTTYFVAAGLPLLAQLAGQFASTRASSWALVVPAVALAAFSSSNGIMYRSFHQLSDPFYVPVEATEFLSKNAPQYSKLPLYNQSTWGGYLGWRLSSQGYRVFEDGRYALFRDLLLEERDASSDPKAWQAFLDRHGIQLAVVDWSQVRLMNPKAWSMVHVDAQAVVCLRAAAENSPAFPRIQP